jgi:hypothetical protein
LRTVIALIVMVTVPVLPRGASGQTHPTLVRARQEYINQNHKKVIELVKPLVEPRSVLATEEEEAEAYELLGLSYWWLKKFKAAEAAFLILLSMRPKRELNPAVHARGVIKFFEEIRRKVRKKPIELRTRQRKELESCRSSLEKCRTNISDLRSEAVVKTVIRRKRWMAFIPFGVGQFHNGDTAAGWVFFSVEAALALANITTFILAETSWVRDGPGDLVSSDPESVRRAQNVQIAQITTGTLFLAVAVAGVVEALVSFEPEVVKTRPLLEPPESSKKEQASSLRLRPFLGPGGGGLTVTLDF